MSSRLLLTALLVPRLVAGAVVRAKSSCGTMQGAAGTSLLEVSSSTTGGCGQTFTPAHFTCSSCDTSACKGCKNVICDLSKCIGKFYKQECWCKKPLNPAVDKFFCDSDCTGGLCNTNGLKCETRESACKPWWWCKLPPPKTAASFLQMSSKGGQESSQALNERLQKSQAQVGVVSVSRGTSGALKKQIDDFSFSAGEWTCDSALLPKPDEDPVTLAQFAAGFIVLDANTCTGGFFKSKCYCYDRFLYLRGEDPKTNELQCDDGCGAGPCGGKTCGKLPPAKLPAPTPAPPMDPLLQELANEGMLRNYGTEMSPVQ